MHQGNYKYNFITFFILVLGKNLLTNFKLIKKNLKIDTKHQLKIS